MKLNPVKFEELKVPKMCIACRKEKKTTKQTIQKLGCLKTHFFLPNKKLDNFR